MLPMRIPVFAANWKMHKTTREAIAYVRELSVLNRAVEETRQGHGCVVLVAGPPGIGKTSLLRAATATASDAGFLRLRARAGQLERDFAYGCIRQLLEPVIVRATGAERKRLFAGAAAFARPLFEPTGVTQLSPPRAKTVRLTASPRSARPIRW